MRVSSPRMSDHPRRERYTGSHPKRFDQKYKELSPQRYAADVERVKERGQTPAGTHRPICLDEIVEILHPAPGETGLDATLGWGGHAAVLWEGVLPGGRLFAIDVDSEELPKTEARLRALDRPADSLIVRHQNFSAIDQLLPTAGGFDFVLADLGVSSMQIDNPARGFSYKATAPLDLRLNPQWGRPAWSLLEGLTRRSLENLLTQNADEPHAALLARAIVHRQTSIKTTTDLAEVIRRVVLSIEPAESEETARKTLQRCFQALRVEVNREFEVLEKFLTVLPDCLNPGARVAVLTFHSGEENRVRHWFEQGLKAGVWTQVSQAPIRASTQERYDNPRSKSARLHWAVK